MAKILIIGGVAGGAGAAARLRRLSEEDTIIMFEKDSYMSFANCGLPYYIGKTITNRDKLFVQKSENFSKRFNVDVRENNEVISIDTKQKVVKVIDHKSSKEYEESYDRLVISTGASAFFPPIKGIEDAKNIFAVKNIPDTDNIFNYIEAANVKKALVIGGGFIGVEMLENLLDRNIETTLVDMAPTILSQTIDTEFANVLHKELEDKGANLVFNDVVTEFSDNGKQVITKNGLKIEVDLIIMSAGIKPNTKFINSNEIKLNDRGYIEVDENFKTSVDEIYAVGDATLVKSDLYNKSIPVPLAWPANRHARLVADSINNKKTINKGINGASIIKVFDYTYASVGLTEKQASELDYNYDIVFAQRGSHAGYYPGSEVINLKVIYDKKTNKILGAAGIGKKGVDKRIDVIATAMRFGGKVNELSSIELCYAPPFNSAKDPVNIIGYIAENVIDGIYKTTMWHEIDSIIEKGGLLLDVRTPSEYSRGHIKNSVNLELDDLRNNLDKLPANKKTPIYVTCQVGHRAYLAIQILRNNGYTNLSNLVGGYSIYSKGKNI